MRLIEDEDHDIRELIKKYRLYLRTTQNQAKARGSHGAFPTSLQGKDTDGKDTDSKPKCVCQSYHYYAECPYLIESKRPKDWKLDEDIQKKIEDTLKKDHWKRRKVESVKKAAKEALSSGSAKPSVKAKPPATGDDDEPSAFAISEAYANHFTVDSNQSTTSYALHDSFILDSGATLHCCNTYLRFHNIAPGGVDDKLIAGEDEIQIEGFGDIYITADGPNGPRQILLQDVAYVPSLHTSVVSLRKFIQKDVHWDTQQNRLTYKDHTYCFTPMQHGQWVLEYNPLPQAFAATVRKSAKPNPKSKATITRWHKRMGHLRDEAIQHLEDAAQDVEVVPRDRYTIPPCETCRLSSAKELISRIPTPQQTQPFGKVHFDLIQMRTGFNEDTEVGHFLDDATRMNFVYTLRTKGQALQTVQDFCEMTERQYNLPVKVIRLDGERSLQVKFEDWAAEKGITIERSPPYTPEQNGAAERSGGVLIARATSLRIEANLPESLWPEIYRTAGYLINRSPTAQFNWSTPLE
jgi:hypothetical protein